jgi:uncharacterized protein (DUF305 family)
MHSAAHGDQDPEIKRLCDAINGNQQAEIDQMKALLERLSK